MSIDIAGAAGVWARRHQRFVAEISEREAAGQPAAIFSSAYHAIVCLALDIPNKRPQGDIDLLTQRRFFDQMAPVLGARVIQHTVKFETGDGLRVTFPAREAIAHIGGDEVQFMDPLTPIRVGRHTYNTEFTPAAVAARSVIQTTEGAVPLAHPIDTIGMYGILQRGGGKNDALHTAMLLGAMPDIFSDPYMDTRAAEMGWDDRVWRFVLRASDVAARPLALAA